MFPRPSDGPIFDHTDRPAHPQRGPISYEEFLEWADENRYDSAVVPGFWLHASWLWREPLPKVLDVARQWRGVE